MLQIVVPLGSPVCFSSNLRDVSGKAGTWGTDGVLLKLNPSTGAGVTTQVGNVTLWYKVSPTVIVTTELSITPIQKVS